MRNLIKGVIGCLVFLLGVSCSAVTYANAPIRVAVIEFDTMGNLEIRDAGKIVGEWMLTSLANDKNFDLKAREVLLKKVVMEQVLSSSSLIDENTALKLGNIYGVDGIITGSVTKWGKTTTVEARLLDAQTGSIIKTGSVKAENTEDIPQRIQQLASMLSTRTLAPRENTENNASSLTVNSVKGYEFWSIAFFEHAATKLSDIPKNEIIYTNRFPNDARFIHFVIKTNNPYYGKEKAEPLKYQIEVIAPGDIRKAVIHTQSTPQKEWGSITTVRCWGNKERNSWSNPGVYKVNIYFEDTYVGSGSFEIYKL